MRTYKIISSEFYGETSYSVEATFEDGSVWSIPFNEANADYQQYLVDTDGGLPLPKETKEDK